MSLPKEETKLLSLSRAAKRLGVSVDTVRRWENKGKLQGIKTPGGHRRFSEEELNKILSLKKKDPKTQSAGWRTKIQNQILPTVIYPLPDTEYPNLYDQLPSNRKTLVRATTMSFLWLTSLVMLSKTIFPMANNTISKYVLTEQHSPSKLTERSRVLQAATGIPTFAVNVPSELREAVTIAKDLEVAETTTTDTLDTTTFVLGGTTVTSSATEINYLDGMTLTDGGVVYSTDTGLAVTTAGTSNQVFVSVGADTPVWKNLTDLDTSLDVDKIDGLDSTAFLRSNASDTFESGSTLTIAGTIDINSDISIADTNIAFDGSTTTFTTTGDLFIQGASGNQVTIGGTTSLAKLGIDGNSDEIQLLVQGHSTQTTNTFVIEQSDGTDIFSVGNTGVLTLTNSGSTNTTFNLSGTADFVIQDNGTTFVTFNSNGDMVLADNTMLDLSSIIHDDSTSQGLKLPQTTSFTALSTGEGFIGWDSDDNKLVMFNGTAWVDVAAAGGSLFTDGGTITYLTATTDDLALGGSTSDASLFFDQSASALSLNPYSTGAGNTGEIRFEELEANGDNYSGFKAPDTLAGNVIYTLPSADATTSNQVLASSAAGVLSWIDVSAGAGTLWTDGGTTTYMTSTTDDMAVGGTTSEAALFLDVSASALSLNPYNTLTGNTGEIRFEELEANGDNYTGFKSPDSLAANVIYTFPSADATVASQVLSSNASGVLSWISATGISGSAWTRADPNVYTTTTTDEVILGGTTPLSSAKLSIDGDTDQIQFLVQGNATQTTSLAVFEQSDGTDVLTVSNAGNLTAAGVLDINGTGTHDIAGTLNLSGTTLTASGDLTITPVGGDVILGSSVALTASKINKVIVVDGNTYAQTCAGINAAIDALGSSGGEIYLPQATYTCAVTITIDYANTTIRGAGRGTIIQPVAWGSWTTPGDVINNSEKDNMTLRDFQIDGTNIAGGGLAHNLIEVFRADDNLIENVYAHHSDQYAIYVYDTGEVGCNRNKIINNKSSDNDDAAIAVSSCPYSVVNDNVISSQGGSYGIWGASRRSVYSGNRIVTTATYGITAGGAQSSYTDNYINGGTNGIQLNTSDSSITNNVIDSSTTAINMNNSTGVTKNVIANNHFISNTNGINLFGNLPNRPTDNVILTNTFTSVTNPYTNSAGGTANGIQTATIQANQGNIAIGEPDGTPDTTLELYMVTGGDPTFSMTDGDVAHGVTTVANTDAFLYLGPVSSTVGGAYLQGLADATGVALQLRGIQSSDPTDTTPAISLIAAKASGTGVVDLGAAETVFQVANNDDTAAITVLGSGAVGLNDVTPDAKLNVLSTTEQLRLDYDDSNYASFTVGSTGNLTMDLTGTSPVFVFSDALDVNANIDLDSDSATALTVGDGTNNYVTVDTTTDAGDTLFTLTGTSGGITSGKIFSIVGDTVTTGNVVDVSADGLSTGNALYLESTSTALSSGNLGYLYWNPGSATTTTGDILRLNVGSNGTVGYILNVQDAGSTVFGVSETQITSALPHQFTAAGDVSMAYDLIFTNQTASYIKSYAPLYIEAGESFENNDLTLRTYGTGNVILDFTTSTGTGDFQISGPDPTIILDTETATDTDFWMAVIEDAGSDDDDIFQIGDGTTAGTNPFLTLDTSGNMSLGNDTTPDYLLELYDATNTPALALSDDDIAHGVTTVANTDVFAHLTSLSTTDGGAQLTALADNVNTAQALSVRGILGNTPDDTVPAIKLVGAKGSGTGIVDLLTDETVFQVANNDDTAALTILGDGATGIGTVTPLGLFHVSSANAATYGKALAIFNHDENQDLLTASASGTTKFAVSSTGELFIGSNTTLTTSTATCWESKTRNGATVYQISDCTGTPADYAEQYPVETGVDYGDVVSLGSEDVIDKQGQRMKRLIKTSTEYDSNAVGIVSNNYHDFTSAGSASLDPSQNPMPVALSGRVPVKVASNSEPIQPGDFVTTSTQAGRAMKATKSGYVIGKALEGWDPANPPAGGTIMIFVNNTFYIGDLADGGNLAVNNQDPSTNNQTNTNNPIIQTPESDQTATESALVADIETLKTKVAELEGKLVILESSQILGEETVATGSAELTTLGDTVITGTLNIGTTQIDSATGSIDTIGILKIQPLALDNIEFLGGLITFDTKGNIVAKEITAEKYVVLGESAGHSILPAGSTKIEIATSQVTADSLTLVTPTTITNHPLVVTQKEEGVGFTVEVNSMQPEDVEFDWLIIDHKE